jgi:glycosyltransferase involved in cell wall biosynthesis
MPNLPELLTNDNKTISSLEPNINEPLVSVIVTTYNLDRYVIDTLNSIKNQTYKNIELVITDDASSDKTVEICNNWLIENHSRFVRSVIITSERNKGIPSNYNRGLLATTGEWIKPIAGDDSLESECIRENVNYVLNNKDVFVLFSHLKVYNNNFSDENYVSLEPLTPPTDLINPTISAQQQFRLLLIRDRVGYVASQFFKKEILLDLNGWDERYEVEDNPMWLKLTKNGYKLHFLEKALVKYRVHNNSHSHSAEKDLINRHYIKMEQWRIDNVYPFLSWPYRLDYKYKYKVFIFLRKLFKNKRNNFANFLLVLLIKWANPFKYCLYGYSIINRYKKKVS